MLELLPPSPATEKRMKEQLCQDPETTARDVQHLKDWLSKQPHLPQVEDDVFLGRFLYCCKNSLTRCKEFLDMHYTVRGAMPEFFSNRDPTADDIRRNVTVMAFSRLPRLSPEGYRVTVIKVLDPEPSHFDPEVFLRRCLMLMDAHLLLERWLGNLYVVDLQGARWAGVSRFQPQQLRRFLLCLQNAFPNRVKGMHFVNVPSFIDRFLSVLRPMMKEKLKDRIHVHTDHLETLYQHIPRKNLPVDYGGETESIRVLNDKCQRHLESCKKWFADEDSKMSDESKRVGKVAHAENLFGVEGSFRKLTID